MPTSPRTPRPSVLLMAIYTLLLALGAALPLAAGYGQEGARTSDERSQPQVHPEPARS